MWPSSPADDRWEAEKEAYYRSLERQRSWNSIIQWLRRERKYFAVIDDCEGEDVLITYGRSCARIRDNLAVVPVQALQLIPPSMRARAAEAGWTHLVDVDVVRRGK